MVRISSWVAVFEDWELSSSKHLIRRGRVRAGNLTLLLIDSARMQHLVAERPANRSPKLEDIVSAAELKALCNCVFLWSLQPNN